MQNINRRTLLKAGTRMLPVLAVGAAVIGNKVSADTCQVTHIDGTISQPIRNNCTGETLDVTVTQHGTLQICTDRNGAVQARLHIEFHGTVVGETTGTRYVVNEQSFEKTKAAPGGCPFSQDIQLRLVAVSQGSAPNLHLLTTFTFASDASCNITTISTASDVDCTP